MFRKRRDKGWRDDRGDDPFGDFFGEFRRIDEIMNELMKTAFSSSFRAEPGKPFVYGFSMRTGPDGKPIIEEFGNVRPHGRPVISDAREPLVDVIDRENEVVVIAELPGVDKEKIDLEVGKDTVEIKVDTPEKKYYKLVELPAEVEEEGVEATYKNGVLEVKLKRKEKKKEKSKKVKIK